MTTTSSARLRAKGDRYAINPRGSLDEDPAVPARDKSRDIGENPRQSQAAWVRQVVRRPHGIELFLVRPQALEVVHRRAMFIEEAAHASPERRHGRLLEPCHG